MPLGTETLGSVTLGSENISDLDLMSMWNFCNNGCVILPPPSVDITQAEKQMLLGFYSGILAVSTGVTALNYDRGFNRGMFQGFFRGMR